MTKTIFLPYEIMLYIRRMQMENTIAKNIIYYAYNRTKQHEVAKALGYSTKQLTRICKIVFNRTYKQFQRELIFSTILERIRDCNTPQSIADAFFNGNVHQLYAYVKSFLNVPPKQISTKGWHYMTAAEIQILETKVITMLATNPTKNLTFKTIRSSKIYYHKFKTKRIQYYLSSRSL